jgi:hypothetical protein
MHPGALLAGLREHLAQRGPEPQRAADLTADENLVAIWRSRQRMRFQNYRAKFTVLDIGTVPRLDHRRARRPALVG